MIKLPLNTNLEEIKNLLSNILLLKSCTFLLHLIRMDAQSSSSINLFDRSSSNQISQRYRLPAAFRPKHLHGI
ncbi:unnamed protein product [Musa acuminata subsp. burmannicoides]